MPANLQPNAKTITALQSKPKPIVSDNEVRAAKYVLDDMAEAAGRDQPVPDVLVRFMLEEAAMVRLGMKPPPARR